MIARALDALLHTALSFVLTTDEADALLHKEIR